MRRSSNPHTNQKQKHIHKSLEQNLCEYLKRMLIVSINKRSSVRVPGNKLGAFYVDLYMDATY